MVQTMLYMWIVPLFPLSDGLQTIANPEKSSILGSLLDVHGIV